MADTEGQLEQIGDIRDDLLLRRRVTQGPPGILLPRVDTITCVIRLCKVALAADLVAFIRENLDDARENSIN